MSTKLSVDEILAKNLTYAMSLRNARYTNANALGVACQISPNTIRNIIDPACALFCLTRAHNPAYYGITVTKQGSATWTRSPDSSLYCVR